jgi:hypothetical protein
LWDGGRLFNASLSFDRGRAVEVSGGFERLRVEVLPGTALEAAHISGTARAERARHPPVLAAEQAGYETHFRPENPLVEFRFLKFQVLKHVLQCEACHTYSLRFRRDLPVSLPSVPYVVLLCFRLLQTGCQCRCMWKNRAKSGGIPQKGNPERLNAVSQPFSDR